MPYMRIDSADVDEYLTRGDWQRRLCIVISIASMCLNLWAISLGGISSFVNCCCVILNVYQAISLAHASWRLTEERLQWVNHEVEIGNIEVKQ